ncbi:MAG: carbohydrate binding family 9 domain-containing protein [Caulobacterales bacterium]|nr:carbohydrate binding family 9 domain-containing protein [Caulobacterales bacterium]
MALLRWPRLPGGAFAVLAAMAAGGPSVGAEDIDFSTYRPSTAAALIARADAPVIDGDLSDAAWARATEITAFYQVDPEEGVAPSQPTRALLTHDETTLYVGVYAYDDPSRISATIQERDGDIFKDDVIRVAVDSFNSKRNGYQFETNPLGSRRDLILQNNRTILDEWNVIWDVGARIVEDGWTAEFAIPFRSISYDPRAEVWGLQISRKIARLEEEIRWSSIDRSLRFLDISRAGEMAAPQGIESGLGLDVQTFGAVRWSRDWETPGRDDDVTIEPSGNLFYKVTPSLTGALTFNTDFSDTPLDARQVNTGRFSLFFPETRDFFLQDAAIFEFGGRALNPGRNDPEAEIRNGSPLFTRRIGIVGDDIADIVAGAKLSGSVRGVESGLLTVRTGDTPTFEAQQLTMGRVSAPVLRESKAGLVFSNGDPTGQTDNTVVGTDFQYRTSSLFGLGVFHGDFFYQRSSTSDAAGAVEDDAFGFELAYPNDRVGWKLNLREIGSDFDPRLGFANRRGIRRLDSSWRYRWRPEGPIRRIDAKASAMAVTGLDDELESRLVSAEVLAESDAGGVIGVFADAVFEFVREPFLLPNDILVPAGEYEFGVVGLFAETADSRPLSVELDVECCGFVDGELLEVAAALEWRPSRYLLLELEQSRTRVSVTNGEVVIYVSSVEANLNLTPEMQLATQLQYDNISEDFTLFSRFRWEPTPGTELFLALAHSARLASADFPTSFRSSQSGATVRVGHTFRF